jgi:hypothetical protein
MSEEMSQEEVPFTPMPGPGPEDLRWPLVLGTILVLYGSLMVALQLLRIFWVAQIFLGFAGNPPGALVFLTIFLPILGGIFLGLMLFLGGVLMLRMNPLGPRLVNIWSLLSVLLIGVVLVLRLVTVEDVVRREAQLAESAREMLRAESNLDEEVILERYPELDVAEMKAYAIRVDFSWMVMTLCFPVGIVVLLNLGPIARSRRTWSVH